jgi:hypothetical protein
MANLASLKFIPNKTIEMARGNFVDVNVNTAKVIESWRDSIFSFEWLEPDGTIKSLSALPAREQPKRQAVEAQIKNNQTLETPILGIGISDNVEIGSGRAVFLTLATLGYETLPVHIPKSNETDFKPFLAKID